MIQETTITGEFKPFPAYTDRAAWEALPEETRTRFCVHAGELLGREWPSLPAAAYMDFYRNGNRSRYEALCFGRRQNLLTFLLAECIEGKGAYLDEIINGVWLICEETSWVIPAHNNHSAGRNPRELPDIERDIYVDLFAAETGSLLSWVYYFLSDAIAERAPLVKRRIELEVERRILLPVLAHDDFGWMGLSGGGPVNNWNPWINSNALTAYLVFAPVFPRFREGAAKTIKSINRFIQDYPEDGGCDEGPGYFGVAGASLYDFIEELGQVAEVSYLYRDTRIRNIPAYLYKVYIANNYYVNYADAHPRVYAAADLLDRAGKDTGDETLRAFAAFIKKNKRDASANEKNRGIWSLYRLFADLFMTGFTNPDAPGAAFHPPQVSWFPGIEVVTAREGEDTDRGLFLSAKGGHNGESHNHNDVGNFILYLNGRPVLIDAGSQTYTKFTFSDKRYTFWNHQSGYHNTPSVNGTDQAPGREYKASGISFDSSGGTLRFSLDIAAAYPEDAALESYRREFVFSPGKGLEMRDAYSLKEWKAPLVLNFLCAAKPEISEGRAALGEGLVLRFENAAFNAEIDAIALDDPLMRSGWQRDTLYRLRLVKQGRDLSGQAVLKFEQDGL